MLQVSLAIYESGRTGHAVRPDSMLRAAQADGSASYTALSNCP